MKVRKPSPTAASAFVAVVGFAAALTGLWLLAGFAWVLVVGGAALVALGFLADVG